MGLADLLRGRAVDIPLTNKSGGALVEGDVVIIGDGATDEAFDTTTTGQYEGSVGVVQESVADNASGRVRIAGYCPVIKVNGTVTREHYIETHTTATEAVGNSTRQAGSFGQFLTGGSGTVSGVLWGQTDQTAAGGGSFDADVHMPRSIFIPMYQPTDAATGTWAITSFAGLTSTIHPPSFGTAGAASQLRGIALLNTGGSSPAQNDEVSWQIPLSAGTWKIRLTGYSWTSGGIAHVRFDDVDKGTIDMYAASTGAKDDSSITGITVATTALTKVAVKAATKNASSASYSLPISGIYLTRTA